MTTWVTVGIGLSRRCKKKDSDSTWSEVTCIGKLDQSCVKTEATVDGMYIQCSTLVRNCCKGDISSQWEIAIFDHLGLWNPWTDGIEIWRRSVERGDWANIPVIPLFLLTFVHFLLVPFWLTSKATSDSAEPIFTRNVSNDLCLLWVSTTTVHFYFVVHPKPPKLDSRSFKMKISLYLKSALRFWRNGLLGGSAHAYNESKMAASRHIENI